MTKILFIDNYDSNSHTIVNYLKLSGAEVTMVKSDASMERIEEHMKSHDIIFLGPGPNSPDEAGIYLDILKKYDDSGNPIIGLCLGMQAIGVHFGADLHSLDPPVHGKTSTIEHDGKTIYRSLVTRAARNPSEFIPKIELRNQLLSAS